MEIIKRNFDVIDTILIDGRYISKKVFITLPCFNEADFKKTFMKSIMYLSTCKQQFHINFISNNPEFNVNSCSKSLDEYIQGKYSITIIGNGNTTVSFARIIGLNNFKQVQGEFDYFLTLDDDTFLKSGCIEKSIFMLEESGYDFLGQDFLQIKSTLFPLYGTFYEKKIRNETAFTFGANFFLIKADKAILGCYHPNVYPREDGYYQATLMEYGAKGCKARINISHKRHKRKISEDFCQGSSRWIESAKKIFADFPNLVKGYTKHGSIVKKIKSKEFADYVYDDEYLYKIERKR
jgi:hypothetical protein